MSLLRKVRALFKTALVWGAAWAPVGVVWGIASWLGLGSAPWWSMPLVWVVPPAIMWGTWGFVNGAAFAALLAAGEARRPLDELSPARAALWGALGGGAMPLLVLTLLTLVTRPIGVLTPGWMVSLLGAGAISAALGAASAAGTVTLARRAPDPALAAAAAEDEDEPATPLPAPGPPLTTPPTVPWRTRGWRA